MFPLFLKSAADVLAPRLSVVFGRFLRLGSFPAGLRQANVTPIPKGPSSSSVANYQCCSRCLSIWWRFVSDDLWNTVVYFQPPSLLIRKVWVPVILCVSQTLQSALESGQKARIVQIDFSAAFDRVNHQGILYKLSSEGIGGSVLSVLTQFLSNRSQYVLVDGCRSKLVNVVSGVLQSSVLGLLLLLLQTLELFSILVNKLIG